MNGLLLALLEASRLRPLDPFRQPESQPRRPSLLQALRGRERLSLLAEFKRRSPSDHELAPTADLATQLRSYQQGCASGVSVLTEPTRFGGSLDDLRAAVAITALPILRKDFLVRPEQVAESRAHGASAVLLIARCLPGSQLHELVHACRTEGIEMLIECHDEGDLECALSYQDAMIGINNRDLDTLHIDREVFLQLAPRIPRDRVVVAESGYQEPAHVEPLLGLADAVLVGTALMRGGDAARWCNRSIVARNRS